MRNTGIITAIAEVRIRFGNGLGYFYEFRWPVLLGLASKAAFPNLSLYVVTLFVLLIIISLIILGHIDLKYIKLHQTQEEIATRKYNPFFTKLEKSVNGKHLNK